MFIKKDDIKPFESKVWLASPTMHGDDAVWKFGQDPSSF